MPTSKQIYTDAEFMAWAESRKPCKRCLAMFIGPVCACEWPTSPYVTSWREPRRRP